MIDQFHNISPKIFAALAVLFLFTSCLPEPILELDSPAPLDVGSTQNSPTPPVTWFPATSTPTAFPHASSTPAPIAQSGIGDLISDTDLIDPANWSNVSTNPDDPNKLIWNDGALYFAMNQPPSSIFSLNKNLLLTNFYMEVEFAVNRCSPNDTYGITFLAANERFGDRLVLRCDGNIRIMQARDNLNLPLTDWVYTGAAPPSAPGTVKAAIWSYNGELRFFLNDQIQFTLLDRYYSSGGIGFFVEAKDPAGMNIKIHNLKLYNLQATESTPIKIP